MVANEFKQVLKEFVKSLKVKVIEPWQEMKGCVYIVVESDGEELLKIAIPTYIVGMLNHG